MKLTNVRYLSAQPITGSQVKSIFVGWVIIQSRMAFCSVILIHSSTEQHFETNETNITK